MKEVSHGTGDKAVQARTGRDWQSWFEILDAAEAQKWSHKEIVAFLAEHYNLEPWWQQSVTVTYEKARGLRQKHQMADGYQVSRTLTLSASPETVFTAWQDEAQRLRWLPDAAMTLRSQNAPKTLRFTWMDGGSIIEVRLTPRKEMRTQVAVQQSKLSDAAAAEAMKVYWAAALRKLEDFLNEGW